MIGGPPVFFAPAPVSMLPPGYGPVPYAPPPPAPVRTAQAPRLVARSCAGRWPNQPPRQCVGQSVAMPSPDQLGVNIRQAAAACDWTAAHRRMQDLGVISFQMDRLNADIFQVVCLLPTSEPGRTHRIEAHGATEAEAVRCALDERSDGKTSGDFPPNCGASRPPYHGHGIFIEWYASLSQGLTPITHLGRPAYVRTLPMSPPYPHLQIERRPDACCVRLRDNRIAESEIQAVVEELVRLARLKVTATWC